MAPAKYRKRTETRTGRPDEIGAARSCSWRSEPGNLILACHQIVGKYAFEPALFVLIVQQDHGSNPQRMPARVAGGHFSLQVLKETIRKVVLIGGASRRFHAALAAVRTGVLQSILLRIAAERSPTRVTNPNSLFRRKTHDFVPRQNMKSEYVMHEYRKLVHKKRILAIH